MVEDVVRTGRLLDTYGPLLTPHQQRCMALYFYDDLSLAEIGAELHISRQGVHDLLQRASQGLEHYEAKLHIAERSERIRAEVEHALLCLDKGGAEDIKEPKRVLTGLDI